MTDEHAEPHADEPSDGQRAPDGVTDGTPVAPGERTAALLADVERLEAALELAGDRAPDEVHRQVEALLDGVHERLALGVDQTVVALIGGTGSGKSSLFNALTRLRFADVGVRRPTTSQVTACVWAHDATALLDWLGVEPERRIARESALDADTETGLRGLVLLDLPDYDSVEAAHQAVVDRLVPQVDLLVWVVDPQKYADDALHTGYLRRLAGHEAAMLVLLNQIDTVPEHARGDLVADVSRLLTDDGLPGVPVLAVSATTGDGLADVRRTLAPVVEGRGVAELRAAAELDDAAAALAGAVGDREAGLPTARAVDALLEAAGVPGEVAAVAAQAPAASEPSISAPTLGPVQPDRADLVREAWLAEVADGLPAPWRDSVVAGVADHPALVRALDGALDEVEIPALPPRTDAQAWTPWLAGGIGLLAVILALMLSPWAWLVAGVAVLVGLGSVWWTRRSRAAAARAASNELLAAGRAAVQTVVERHLAAPTREVLGDHELVRLTAVTRRGGRRQRSAAGGGDVGPGGSEADADPSADAEPSKGADPSTDPAPSTDPDEGAPSTD